MCFLSTTFETVYVRLFRVRYEITRTRIPASFIRLETTPKLKASYPTFPPNFTAVPKLIQIPAIPANSLISGLNTFITWVCILIIMNSHLTLIGVLLRIGILIFMRAVICFDLIYPDLLTFWFLSIFLIHKSRWVETKRIHWMLSLGGVVTELSIA